jgi:hypothetical protein
MTNTKNDSAASTSKSKSQYVDSSIGKWAVRDERGQHGILLIKDIDAFCQAITAAQRSRTLKTMRDQIRRSLDFVEFGKITIKDGMVHWKGGDFVEEPLPLDSSYHRKTVTAP